MENSSPITSLVPRPLTGKEIVVAGLGMLLLAILFCGPRRLLHPELAPFDSGDSAAAYFPYCVRSHCPLTPEIAGAWDPTLWTGLPESHSPFGRYYPPAWLLFELFSLGLALTLTFVFHHAWAGLGTYLLLRTGNFG